MDNSARRRVLMLIPNLGLGGAQRSFFALKRLLSAHHEVMSVAFDRMHEPCDVDPSDASMVYLTDDRKACGGVRRLWRWFKRFRQLRQLKHDYDPDVSISFLEGADYLNVLTAREDRVVLSIRGSKKYDPHIKGFSGLLRRRMIWPLLYPRADAIVGISDGVTQEVRALGFMGHATLGLTIGLAIDVDELLRQGRLDVEPELEALAGSPCIVAWGRLSSEKGYQHLLRVFANVKRHVPDAKLILVGEGSFKEELVRVATGLSLSVSLGVVVESADVLFVGYRADAIRYAKIARVFALSSDAEGFSNSLIEALVAGIPVVASDCPWGARSVLSLAPIDPSSPYPTTFPRKVEFGVLMPRIDDHSFEDVWVSTLVDALTSDELRFAYEGRGLERARDFEISKVSSKWLALVESLAAKKGTNE